MLRPQMTTLFDFSFVFHLSKTALLQLGACLHEGGGPQVGEVTCGGLEIIWTGGLPQLSGLPHLPGFPTSM